MAKFGTFFRFLPGDSQLKIPTRGFTANFGPFFGLFWGKPLPRDPGGRRGRMKVGEGGEIRKSDGDIARSRSRGHGGKVQSIWVLRWLCASKVGISLFSCSNCRPYLNVKAQKPPTSSVRARGSRVRLHLPLDLLRLAWAKECQFWYFFDIRGERYTEVPRLVVSPYGGKVR